MRKNKLTQGVLSLITLIHLSSFAHYTIQSDQSHYDHQRGIAVFRGHVHATNDDQHIRGDELRLFLNPKHQVTQLICLGNPAYYDYLPADPKKQLRATAHQIRFDQKNAKASFIQQATIKQVNNSIRAHWIDYWPNTNLLKTYNGPSKKQTHIILQANEISS